MVTFDFSNVSKKIIYFIFLYYIIYFFIFIKSFPSPAHIKTNKAFPSPPKIIIYFIYLLFIYFFIILLDFRFFFPIINIHLISTIIIKYYT
jgi:hypothetical protein